MSGKKFALSATAAVAMLAGAVAVSQEGVGKLPAASRDTSERRLAALERRFAATERKIAELEQQNAQLRAFITINGNSLTIKSAQALTIQAGTDLLLKSNTVATLQAGVTAHVKGPLVHLNGGGKPVARIGDAIQVSGPAGQIIQGSPTVFAN